MTDIPEKAEKRHPDACAMIFAPSWLVTPVWRIRNSRVLGQRSRRISDSSHTSNLLNLVWFSDLKFLTADAMEILGTSNPPH